VVGPIPTTYHEQVDIERFEIFNGPPKGVEIAGVADDSVILDLTTQTIPQGGVFLIPLRAGIEQQSDAGHGDSMVSEPGHPWL
jgi:hypothetical protein